MIKELETLKSIQLDAGLIFSGKSSNKTVTGYDKPTSFTPKEDPYYVFHESSRDVIVWSIVQDVKVSLPLSNLRAEFM